MQARAHGTPLVRGWKALSGVACTRARLRGAVEGRSRLSPCNLGGRQMPSGGEGREVDVMNDT